MNIPIKVLKSNSIANEKVRNQQKIAQKYYSSVINSKTKSSLNENKNVNEKSNSQNQIKNINNIFSTTNLKEEIIRWFFSFGLNHKLVLSTIENKWLINCLHYMYTKLKNEPNTKFSYLDGEAPECGIENFHHKFSGKQPTIFTNKKMSNNLFFHFFSTIEDNKKNYTNYNNCYGINNISFNCGSSTSSLLNSVNSSNIYYNNKENSEFDFFNEINFYKCEESDISNDYCSYMALSEKIIENEVYFLKIFDHYSKEKAFTNFIPAFWDSQSKYYTYGMPNWFNKKEAYSLQEILIAYFEQTITVKFVLFHLDPNNYNYYYNKYLKNSYIKKLREESDPAIYNENSNNGSYPNKINLDKNLNLNDLNTNKNNKFIKHPHLNNDPEKVFQNIFNNDPIENNTNQKLNAEQGFQYNYNLLLDSPENKASENIDVNSKNLNFYFYNLDKEDDSNLIKDDFEKNLSASGISNNPTNSNTSPINNHINNNINSKNKNFSFIKCMHNIRIHLEKERSYPKGVYDIIELDCYLKKLLKEKSEITSLFYSDIKAMDKLYLQAKGEKLMEEIKENKELKEFLEKKSFQPQEFIPFNRHSKLLKKVSFIDKKDHTFDIDLKYFITSHETIEELLNKILFLDINQIFTYDDIFLKRLFDNIYSIYTYKNLLDLIAEEDKDSEFIEKLGNNNVNSNNNNCNKKKKKKKNTKKSVEKNESSEKTNLLLKNNEITEKNISDLEFQIKKEEKILKSNNYNDEKISINILDNIDDININENNANDQPEKQIKIKNNKDKAIYNNYINLNEDVYNSNDIVLDKNNNYNDDLKHDDSNIVIEEYKNNIINININQDFKNNELIEGQTTLNSNQENKSIINYETMSNKEKNNLKLIYSNDGIKKSNIKNKSDNKIINFATISKNIEIENEKCKKAKSNLIPVRDKDINNCNFIEKNNIKSNEIKIDPKRANSKRDKKHHKNNIIINDNDEYFILKEEKKESIEKKEKIKYDRNKIKNACNISSEIINLEKNPILNIEIQAQNTIQNQKILTQNVANNNGINNNPLANLIHISKENINIVKIDKIKEKSNPYRDVVSKLIDKIKNVDKNTSSEQKSNSVEISFKENLFKSINNNNNQYFENLNNDPLDTICDNFKENLKKANLTEIEKEKILKSPLNKESINFINNLNLLNDNNNFSMRNTNYLNNYVNYIEAENFKNENAHDKNENDTDTAYSSSNQSETNNYHVENSELPCLHENSVDSFEINKLSQNYNSNNLINLKNNLRKNNKNLIKANDISTSKKSDLIDVKNINNYLISPKKNQRSLVKIDSNFDSEFKNGFTKNKDFDLINVNTNINFRKNSNEKRKSLNEKKIEKDINFINEMKEFIEIKNRNIASNDSHSNVNILNSEALIKENIQEKNQNKIHFALNPLASIYKVSNKKINNSSNDLDINKENKNSDVQLKLSQENNISENQHIDLDGNYQESYFSNYNNANNHFNKKYSNFNINSPNSSKSESSFFNGKNDLYASYNMNNYYGNSAMFSNLSYNPLYSAGINPLSSNFPINNQKSYFSFNSPNSIKTKDFKNYQKFEKDKSFLNNNYNNSNTYINQNNNICESKIDQNNNTEQKINKENIEKQNPNTFSENNKKSKNKHKKNSSNINISKDDLNIIKSKNLNFTEIKSQNENKKQKISKLINTSLNQNNINSNTITNNNLTTISNGNTNTISNQNSQNIQIFSNNIGLIPQSQVYQNYIPKNVNFRNFNFPLDITNSFNLGFSPNINNYNFFYPLNMNNVSFMNMNLFNVNNNNNYYDTNFYKKLHNDILEYNQKLEKNISFTKEIKSNVVCYLTEQIKDILSFLNIEINIYGSFANDLSIESSDIDLIVKYELKNYENPNINVAQNNYIIDIEYIISFLTNSFEKNHCMDKVNPIYTASVPIIKLVIDPSKIKDNNIKKCNSNKEMKKFEEIDLETKVGNEEKVLLEDQNIKEKSDIFYENENSIKSAHSDKNFEIKDILTDLHNDLKLQKTNSDLLLELKDSDIYKNYSFNKEELEKVKIDITFSDVNFKSNSLISKDQTKMAVEFTKNNNKKFPEIGYIVKLIKRLLQIENLNNSFKGGLSSFTLFLLVLAFTKIFRNKSILNYYYGVFLVEFFNFYANFDFQSYYIDVNFDMPFLPLTEFTENIPLIKNPFNSNLNAAKSSYRINELKELFGNISDKLNTIKNNFNSNISENLVYSIIFKK